LEIGGLDDGVGNQLGRGQYELGIIRRCKHIRGLAEHNATGEGQGYDILLVQVEIPGFKCLAESLGTGALAGEILGTGPQGDAPFTGVEQPVGDAAGNFKVIKAQEAVVLHAVGTAQQENQRLERVQTLEGFNIVGIGGTQHHRGAGGGKAGVQQLLFFPG